MVAAGARRLAAVVVVAEREQFSPLRGERLMVFRNSKIGYPAGRIREISGECRLEALACLRHGCGRGLAISTSEE